jgi:hypothetical protein
MPSACGVRDTANQLCCSGMAANKVTAVHTRWGHHSEARTLSRPLGRLFFLVALLARAGFDFPAGSSAFLQSHPTVTTLRPPLFPGLCHWEHRDALKYWQLFRRR